MSPLAQSDQLELGVESRKHPPANILLVDDRHENLVALEAILLPLEQRLVSAYSGFDALRYLLQAEFALILMDVQMPEMDGFETVNLIKSRERTRHIPVIFITALSKDNKYVYRGYSAGAVDYMSKPFNPEVLRSKVSVFVDLYNKEKEIERQAELLNEKIRAEAEQSQLMLQHELEEKHLRELTTTLEARVAERTRELVETNRDLESFCYSIAHDLRTPVREIVATSSMLLADSQEKLGPEELEHLHSQSAAAKRIGTLIDDLLRLSRLGRKAVVTEKLDLSDMCRQAYSRNLKGAPNAKFKLDIESGLEAFGDSGLVEILFQNLVENAIKYSPEGGRLRFGSRELNGETVYFLADQGIGFDMKYERKLFLPFERLVQDPAYPGTGIGLALVEKIVKKHGGKVWAEGEPSKGATFYFTLSNGPNREVVEEPHEREFSAAVKLA